MKEHLRYFIIMPDCTEAFWYDWYDDAYYEDDMIVLDTELDLITYDGKRWIEVGYQKF